MTQKYYYMYLLDEDDKPYGADHSPEEMAAAAELCSDMKRRKVAETQIGDVWVSTVFLVFNHQFDPTNPRPLLYETMAFGTEEEHCLRAETKEAALNNHKEVVAHLKKQLH